MSWLVYVYNVFLLKYVTLKNLLEQWSLTGGRESSLAISWFFTFWASSSCQIPDKIIIIWNQDKTFKLVHETFFNIPISKKKMQKDINTHWFSFYPFCGKGAWRNSRSTAKCLEFCVNNFSIFINSYLY